MIQAINNSLTRFAFGILSLLLVSTSVFADDRLTLNFNPDWKFIKDDPASAQQRDFNDSGWATISTPHSYNDTDTFDDFALPGLRGEQNQWSGRTWYRKTFVAPDSWNGKKIYIEFDAIRQVGEVYLNGRLLGAAKNGFIPFGIDLTPYLEIGRSNVLAVMCDNRFAFNPVSTNDSWQARLGKDSANIPENVADIQASQIPWNNPQWHPPQGGIYRDVKLFVVDPLHISLPLYDF